MELELDLDLWTCGVDEAGTRLGRGWDKAGTRLGRGWDEAGTSCQVGLGIGIGIVRVRYGCRTDGWTYIGRERQT